MANTGTERAPEHPQFSIHGINLGKDEFESIRNHIDAVSKERSDSTIKRIRKVVQEHNERFLHFTSIKAKALPDNEVTRLREMTNASIGAALANEFGQRVASDPPLFNLDALPFRVRTPFRLPYNLAFLNLTDFPWKTDAFTQQNTNPLFKPEGTPNRTPDQTTVYQHDVATYQYSNAATRTFEVAAGMMPYLNLSPYIDQGLSPTTAGGDENIATATLGGGMPVYNAGKNVSATVSCGLTIGTDPNPNGYFFGAGEFMLLGVARLFVINTVEQTDLNYDLAEQNFFIQHYNFQDFGQIPPPQFFQKKVTLSADVHIKGKANYNSALFTLIRVDLHALREPISDGDYRLNNVSMAFTSTPNFVSNAGPITLDYATAWATW